MLLMSVSPERSDLLNVREESVSHVSPSGNTLSTRQPVILVAEDDSHLRSLYAYLFAKRTNAIVIGAEHGLEALHQLDSIDRVDLLVSDVEMPVMDGLSLVRWLRQQPRWARTHVVLQTCQPDRVPHAARAALGISRVFGKGDFYQWIRSLTPDSAFASNSLPISGGERVVP
jgi:two-component system chemotaxis response regulator CheY